MRPDATHLITGGLGGIGLKVAAYLAGRGARHLVLLGRSAPVEDAGRTVADLRQQARVDLLHADVADERQMTAAFGTIRRSMPPLCGVFHAAGVLDDGVLLRQTAERFAGVIAPKVQGSWNLHRLSLDCPIEHFVLFSSVAAVVGSPGQAAYAAGNAFMIRLAHYRKALGLPAISLNWGPWDEVGLAARSDPGGRLADRGFAAITPDDGIRALDCALRTDAPALTVADLRLRQWRQFYPASADSPLFSQLADDTVADAPVTSGGPSPRAAVLTAPTARQRQAILERLVRQEVARVLRLPAERITKTTSLGDLGFDSLLALELRNRLEVIAGAQLSATLVWSHPTLPDLVRHVAAAMGVTLSIPERRASDPAIGNDGGGPAERAPQLVADVERLSDEDALRQLTGDP